jgi:heptosyltransferase-3
VGSITSNRQFNASTGKVRAALITARNLGDAVIAVTFLRRAMRDMPRVEWAVWCRPEASFLFVGLPNIVDVRLSHFPMGTSKQFTLKAVYDLGRNLLQMRRLRCGFSVDLTGDVREVTLGRLLSRGNHFSPGWPAGHPFLKMHYLPRGPLKGRLLEIPIGVINVYQVYAMFSEGLAKTIDGRINPKVATPSDPPRGGSICKRAGLPRVGLHPFASQICKLWGSDRWRELMRELIDKNYEVFAFGSPPERSKLLSLTAGILDPSAVITVAVQDFFAKVRELDLLIGLDSFSIHAAYVNGVPAVMINGSNHPELFCPPGVTRLAVAADCGFQPCLNVPRCSGRLGEYMCTRGVAVSTVLGEVMLALDPGIPAQLPLGNTQGQI